MEAHWGQTVQAAEMDCMGALDPLQPHKHHSELKCSNLLHTCLLLNRWVISCKKEIKVKQLCPDVPKLLCSLEVAVQKKKKINQRKTQSNVQRKTFWQAKRGRDEMRCESNWNLFHVSIE